MIRFASFASFASLLFWRMNLPGRHHANELGLGTKMQDQSNLEPRSLQVVEYLGSSEWIETDARLRLNNNALIHNQVGPVMPDGNPAMS